MMRNLVTSLVVHERVTTTDAKAKELRRVAEKLVTKAARVSELSNQEPDRLSQEERAKLVHSKRVVSKHLRKFATDRENNEVDVLWKLFSVLGPRFAERPGGYTRIVKLPNPRKGDNAPMSIIEFVDYDEVFGAMDDDEGEEGGEKKGGILGSLFKGRKKDEPAEDDE